MSRSRGAPARGRNALPARGLLRRVLPPLGRVVDAFLSRGEGLDERGDPFGPPLDAAEAERLLAAVRAARFAEREPPFLSPLPPPGGEARVPVLLEPPPHGADWAILAPPYGAFAKPGELGLYRAHARALRRQGFGVAALPMPYHGGRAMPELPSGWGFVRADLGSTSRSLASAAAEAAALARHLREARGAARVVGLGLSLGGAAVGLAAALGAPFDALALVAAVDNPASFYGTGHSREARRRTLAKAGYDNARVAEAFLPFSPSTHPAPLPGARLHFGVPPHDMIVPPPWQEAWRGAWGGTEHRLHAHGHGTALASPGVAHRMARALRRSL